MRIAFTLLVTATVVAIHILDKPQFYLARAHQTSVVIEDLVQSKDIRIEGLKHLPRSVVEDLLPSDRSVPWWMANVALLRSSVATNPWVESVSVESCGESVAEKWGCFIISVSERRARFVARVDSDAWLIADDGTFLSPFQRDHWQGVKRFSVPNVVQINGLASKISSPDVVRAQVGAATLATATLEEVIGRRIGGLVFSEKGDLQAFFKGYSFPVVFSASNDSATIRDQAERARALLPKLSDRLGEIERVDLAFSKVGVVTFKAPSERQLPKKASTPGRK
jgi:hypothetical protein